MCASLCISQCMMVVRQIVPAGIGHRVELMVGQLPTEDPPRGTARTEELIAGPRHIEQPETGPQTPFVERSVVRHQRQPLDPGCDLGPYASEIGRSSRIRSRQPVYLGAETAIIIRIGMDQPIDRIDNPTLAHDHHSDRTDTGAFAVGRFEIYGSKIFHTPRKIRKKGGTSARKSRLHMVVMLKLFHLSSSSLSRSLGRAAVALSSALGRAAVALSGALNRSLGRRSFSLSLSSLVGSVSTAAYHSNGSCNHYKRQNFFHRLNHLRLNIYRGRKITDSE